jgi:hypothetical protein
VCHCEELVETIEMDLSFTIFGVRDQIPPRNECGKNLEGTRRQTTKDGPIWPQKWARRPKGVVVQPATTLLHLELLETSSYES